MTSFRLATAAAVAAVVSTTVACSAGGHRATARLPFPADADPCAAYCLRTTPPSTREVPHVVELCPPSVVYETSWRRRIEFDEVCVPGAYEARRTPCVTHRMEEVVVEPGRTEWAPTQCPCEAECWRPCPVPPRTRWCEVTETEGGVEYCAYRPPVHDVVQRETLECVQVPRYVPGQYCVQWGHEPFMPAETCWHQRYDCPPCYDCVPTLPRYGSFAHAPCR